ncbi:Serpentine Receptor, class H [Caenorhabditis elegans]|uniref:Serpentine Receptor, class H n=1 Tax=Caenorhabditis elegans TaxID=6239 RepID=Q7YX45_CAEEL|nr:Serpentine Receptor, class H [Caenorhabditis elegans]CAE17769.3 Serpentine Receptor, class H [Caenorhabditis elegans]|eukprot:NP_001256314.2 Uncharacterized protein CELE_F07B10.4 [Caenorhabditis elegans]
METPFNISSCNFNRYSYFQNIIVLWAPAYGFPVYAAAIFLLKYHSDSQSQYVRAAQFIAVILNFLELVDMSTVFYPQFVVPVLGLQVGGISEFIYPRPILYLAIALILHQGINSTTLFIAHCRLVLLSRSLILRKSSTNVLLRRSNQLSYINYVFFIASVGSILLILNVDNIEYQSQWKKEFFQKYQLNFIWCPKYYVLDPTVWEFVVMMIVACSTTVLFAFVFVLCSITTIAIIHSAKDTMSLQTRRYHLQVVKSFLISCGIQAFFVVLPVVHILLCVYFEFIKTYTGASGMLFYSVFTQAHQGTAFTLFYVLSHIKTKKTWRKFTRAVRKINTVRLFKRSI